jgi:hypothetical protein
VLLCLNIPVVTAVGLIRLIHFSLLKPISLRHILISSRLHLGPRNYFLFKRFPTKILCVSCLPVSELLNGLALHILLLAGLNLSGGSDILIETFRVSPQ